MKSKNLIILCVWSALSIVFVVWGVVGAGYSHNPAQWLIWMLSDFQIFFVITLVFTGAVAFFMPEK
ncbi:MAG: hypothetical protein ACETV1_03240 [Candidatus Bathyarchaeia archaeon]